MAKVVVDEIQLVGSRCGDFDLAGAYLRDRLVDVVPLIESVRPFEECVSAMVLVLAQHVLVLEFGRKKFLAQTVLVRQGHIVLQTAHARACRFFGSAGSGRAFG